jgi:hypothetical protein
MVLEVNCKCGHPDCGMPLEECHGMLCGMKSNCPGINHYLKEQKAKKNKSEQANQGII